MRRDNAANWPSRPVTLRRITARTQSTQMTRLSIAMIARVDAVASSSSVSRAGTCTRTCTVPSSRSRASQPPADDTTFGGAGLASMGSSWKGAPARPAKRSRSSPSRIRTKARLPAAGASIALSEIDARPATAGRPSMNSSRASRRNAASSGQGGRASCNAATARTSHGWKSASAPKSMARTSASPARRRTTASTLRLSPVLRGKFTVT